MTTEETSAKSSAKGSARLETGSGAKTSEITIAKTSDLRRSSALGWFKKAHHSPSRFPDNDEDI